MGRWWPTTWDDPLVPPNTQVKEESQNEQVTCRLKEVRTGRPLLNCPVSEGGSGSVFFLLWTSSSQEVVFLIPSALTVTFHQTGRGGLTEKAGRLSKTHTQSSQENHKNTIRL